VGRECSTNGGEDYICGKARRKETTVKTEVLMGGQYQNGFERDDGMGWIGLI
jgi:hypothetical protein